MIMRFRGGGVGHTSTRAATDIFKQDRDILDMESRRARQKQCEPPTDEEEEGDDDIYMPVDTEGHGSEAAGEIEELEDELSESELIDYGYELEDGKDSEEEEDRDSDVGEGDDNTIELDALGFADY